MKGKAKGLIAAVMIVGFLFLIVIAVSAINNGDNESEKNDAQEESDVPPQYHGEAITEQESPDRPAETGETAELKESDGSLPEESHHTQSPAETAAPIDEGPTQTADTPEPEESSVPDEAAELEQRKTESAESLEKILRTFRENCPETDEPERLSIYGVPAQCFPDNYGGAYISSSGSLVILLSSDSEEVRAFYAAIGENAQIVFEQADFSYRHLVEKQAAISAYAEIESGEEFTILSVQIDEYGNRIIVNLSDISEETIAAFKGTVSSSESILFIHIAGTDEMN
jgi:hypothetical protein